MQTSLNFDNLVREHKIKLIIEVCRFLLGCQALVIPSCILTILVTGQISGITGVIIGVVSLGTYSWIYSFAKKDKYYQAAWLLVCCVFFNVALPYFFMGNRIPMVVSLVIPISLTVALLDNKAVLAMIATCVLFAVGVTSLEVFASSYNAFFIMPESAKALGTITVILISIPASGWLVVISMGNQRKVMLYQNSQLSLMLEKLSERQTHGVQISHEILTLAGNLNKVAQEQTVESQEQAASVTNVTVSLEELSESAGQIAQGAVASTLAAYQTVNIANTVKESSQLANTRVEQGNRAVNESVKRVDKVRERFDILAERMINLSSQTREADGILSLIREISDETHLLSLNASIEAAGSSQSDAGARFAVIAQEIKNLADRSRASVTEVKKSIEEMQGAVASAVLVAEEGKKETQSALNSSYVAGEVIENLSQVIVENANQTNLILEASQEVKNRCEAIKMASEQQKSASNQVLDELRRLNQIAQHTADGSDLITSNVIKLEEVSKNLNHALVS